MWTNNTEAKPVFIDTKQTQIILVKSHKHKMYITAQLSRNTNIRSHVKKHELNGNLTELRYSSKLPFTYK